MIFLVDLAYIPVLSLKVRQWSPESGMTRSGLLDSIQVGALDCFTMYLEHRTGFPSDYLYGNRRELHREGGK